MDANTIRFHNDNIDTSKAVGSISTLHFDIDVTLVPYASDNEMAPTCRIYARSPDGKKIEVGGD